MKPFVVAAVTTLLLSSCGWTTNRNLLPDDPDDKTMQTGNHIPVKDRSAGRASSSADAQSLIQNQKLGSPNQGGGK